MKRELSQRIQRLQDILMDVEGGFADVSDAQNELLDLQRHLALPLTEPNEWGSTPPELIEAFEDHERTHK